MSKGDSCHCYTKDLKALKSHLMQPLLSAQQNNPSVCSNCGLQAAYAIQRWHCKQTAGTKLGNYPQAWRISVLAAAHAEQMCFCAIEIKSMLPKENFSCWSGHQLARSMPIMIFDQDTANIALENQQIMVGESHWTAKAASCRSWSEAP